MTKRKTARIKARPRDAKGRFVKIKHSARKAVRIRHAPIRKVKVSRRIAFIRRTRKERIRERKPIRKPIRKSRPSVKPIAKVKEIPRPSAVAHPKVKSKITYKNVVKVATDRPLAGENIGQMHLQIRIKSPYSAEPVIADGYSLLGDASDPTRQQKMFNQALISAKNQANSYSTDYELLSMEFIYLIKK